MTPQTQIHVVLTGTHTLGKARGLRTNEPQPRRVVPIHIVRDSSSYHLLSPTRTSRVTSARRDKRLDLVVARPRRLHTPHPGTYTEPGRAVAKVQSSMKARTAHRAPAPLILSCTSVACCPPPPCPARAPARAPGEHYLATAPRWMHPPGPSSDGRTSPTQYDDSLVSCTARVRERAGGGAAPR